MLKTIALAVVVVLVTSGTALAERGPLSASLSAASLRTALAPVASTEQSATPNPKRFKHPVRYGALIGAVGGFTVGYIGMKSAVANCPAGRSCSTAGAGVCLGAILGTGLGAIAGWIANK